MDACFLLFIFIRTASFVGGIEIRSAGVKLNCLSHQPLQIVLRVHIMIMSDWIGCKWALKLMNYLLWYAQTLLLLPWLHSKARPLKIKYFASLSTFVFGDEHITGVCHACQRQTINKWIPCILTDLRLSANCLNREMKPAHCRLRVCVMTTRGQSRKRIWPTIKQKEVFISFHPNRGQLSLCKDDMQGRKTLTLELFTIQSQHPLLFFILSSVQE